MIRCFQTYLYIISGAVDLSYAELSPFLNISLPWNFSNDVDDGATRLKWGSPGGRVSESVSQ